MANTNNLQAVIPTILAQALLQLRGFTVMPRLVNLDYGSEAREKGDTIDVPIHSAIEAQEVSPGNTAPDDAGLVPTKTQITLDQWYEAPFFMSDRDVNEAMNGFVPGQVVEATRSIANRINTDIFGLYPGVYGLAGTPGTTPFSTANDGPGVSSATALRKQLNVQKAPLTDRRAVLDVDAAAAALELRAFQDAAWRGDSEGLIEGQIGRKLGFDFYEDQAVPTHTAGTITTGLAVKSATAHAEGVTTITATTAAATGACDLKRGDLLTFAGDSQTYALLEDVEESTAATDVTLKISPGLQVALTGGEEITVKATHTVNLGFHRDAFALAMRPLATPDSFTGGSLIETMTDPLTGLSLRLEISRQHKRTRWAIDALWGVKLVRPELAVRLAG